MPALNWFVRVSLLSSWLFACSDSTPDIGVFRGVPALTSGKSTVNAVTDVGAKHAGTAPAVTEVAAAVPVTAISVTFAVVPLPLVSAAVPVSAASVKFEVTTAVPLAVSAVAAASVPVLSAVASVTAATVLPSAVPAASTIKPEELVTHVGTVRCGTQSAPDGKLTPLYCASGKCCYYDSGAATCQSADYDCNNDNLGWPLSVYCDGAEDCAEGEGCYNETIISLRDSYCKAEPPPVPEGVYQGKVYARSFRICNPFSDVPQCLGTDVCVACSGEQCKWAGECQGNPEIHPR